VRNAPAPSSAIFPAAGFYFFSSPRLRGSVRCGPLGVNGWANHAHNDQLSFELACDGHPVIVDPGSYCYSGDAAARNRFRSARAHNSPVVDGAEQNRFWPGLLFRMVDDTQSRALRWSASPRGMEFEGQHAGYRRLPQRVTVRRWLCLHRAANSVLVADTVAGRGGADVEWFFQIAPGTTVERMRAPGAEALAPPAALRRRGFQQLYAHSQWRIGPLCLRILSTAPAPALSLQAELIEGEFAPSYGTRIAAPRLRVAAAVALPVRIAFAFDPAM
jgi:hypothetical protein